MSDILVHTEAIPARTIVIDDLPKSEVVMGSREAPELKQERAKNYYLEYGRTVVDQDVVKKMLELDSSFVDLTGESGIFPKALSDLGATVVAAEVGDHYSGEIGKHFPVTQLDAEAPLGPQLAGLSQRDTILLNDPFEEHLIPMQRWIEALDWVPSGKFVFYFGCPRTWTPVVVWHEFEKPKQGPHELVFNNAQQRWMEIIVASPLRFNKRLERDFTKVFDLGKELPGVFQIDEGIFPPSGGRSVFEVWQKN